MLEYFKLITAFFVGLKAGFDFFALMVMSPLPKKKTPTATSTTEKNS